MNARAFSLVEMLVVIAIVSVLAAILLPTVQASMEMARRTACAGNCRQIGIGDTFYMDEANGWMPTMGYFAGTIMPTMSSYYSNPGVAIPQYMFDLWPDSIRWCPSIEPYCTPDAKRYLSSMGQFYYPATVKNGGLAFGYHRPALSENVAILMYDRAVDCYANRSASISSGINFLKPLKRGWAVNFRTSVGPTGQMSNYGGRNFDPTYTALANDLVKSGPWSDNIVPHSGNPIYTGARQGFDGGNVLWQDGSVKWRLNERVSVPYYLNVLRGVDSDGWAVAQDGYIWAVAGAWRVAPIP